MYTFSNRLKTFSIILVVLGVLGVAYGFMTSHKSLDEVKTMLVEEHAHEVAEAGLQAQVAASDHDVSDDSHATHVQEQLAKRPWSAVYVAAFFFMMIALGALAFYAIHIAAQAGWSPLLMRVMEGISAYLLPGAIIVVALAVGSHYIGTNNEIFI